MRNILQLSILLPILLPGMLRGSGEVPERLRQVVVSPLDCSDFPMEIFDREVRR